MQVVQLDTAPPAVHRAIVCVDVEGFGDRRRTNRDQLAVREGLYRSLRRAFTQSEISWDDCYHEDRGDGAFVLVTPDVPKNRLVARLPHELVTALREHNRSCTAETRIRLRAAIHAGEIHHDDHGVAGAALNFTFRLLEAAALKSALRDSPGVLALITSDWFFEEVVRHEPASAPATYRRVRVAVKETTASAWLCLPDHPYPPGGETATRSSATAAFGPGDTGPAAGTTSEQVVFTKTPPISSLSRGGARWLQKAAEELADRVEKQWWKEQERRQVHHPFPLAVRFQPAETGLFDHWANIRASPPGTDPEPLPLRGRLDQITEVYRSIPSHRLVVLGAAGAGKTVLTLRFVLDWLADRTPGGPVPVIFGLGSWDPTAVSLRDWMCGQLVRDYAGLAAPAPAAHGGNLAGALVDAGWILPVLDGLDEIASGLQREALKALNQTTTALLLTSRLAEYTEAVRQTGVLTGAAVVELNDLTLDDLADYLPRTSRPGGGGGLHSTVWEPVLAGLRARSRSQGAVNVAAVLTTPLMVALARSVYSGARGNDPAELLDTTRFATPEALRGHLLAAFIRAAYRDQLPTGSGTGRRRQWHRKPDRVQHWLGYLADHLNRLDTSDVAWWQLGTTMRRSSRMVVVGFLAALAFGVTTGVGNVPVDLVATSHGLRFALVRGLVVGFLHGLVAGVAFGYAYGFISQGAAEPSRVRVQIFGRTGKARARFAPRFMAGLGFGLPVALAVVLMDRLVVERIGLGDGLDGGLVGALVFVPGVGLGVGLMLGLMAWLEVPIDTEYAVSPSYLLTVNRGNVAVQMLVCALVFGLPAVFAPTPPIGGMDGPVVGLLLGLVVGLEAAFGAGLGYALSFTAWGQWVALARIWLPLTGRLPWALVAFLDDACERGVLRQAGAVYQFRHAQLKDHLAHFAQAHHEHQRSTST